MVKKEVSQQGRATTLWEQDVAPIPIRKYASDVADTEKLLIFAETGAGKTTYYLNILRYLAMNGVPQENMMMEIIFPDRPTGLVKLYNLIPKQFRGCVDVFPVNDYEDTVRATASAEKRLLEHFKRTGKHGWLVFELMENYWTFAQDYYCRQAYGQTLGDFFAQMQSIIGKNKAEKKTAYEAFAGPFGGPWPIIKFFHNFNWIDKVKRFPYNTVFTSEIKEEVNKDSIFYDLGYRPAGEKHNQHKMDTILYLSHRKNQFYMKPFKLTGYRKLYGELGITNKNGYAVHKDALERLSKMGLSVAKMDDIEEQAGIKPPEKSMEKVIEKAVEVAPNMVSDIGKGLEKLSKEKTVKKTVEKSKDEEDDIWEI